MKKVLLLLFLAVYTFANERIVTLTPSINEIVFSLGLGKNIVANTQYCDYPPESKAIKKIGGYATISLEKILEVKPTVVIGQDYDKKLLRDLNSLGIKTLVFKTNKLIDIKNSILSLGKYFKEELKAKEIVEGIDNSLASLKNITKDKKILLVIGPRKNLNSQIYVVGNHLYFEDIIKASNNKNAYYSKSSNQPVVNSEKIINMNPDIIILLSPFLEGKEDEQKKLIKLWETLPIQASLDKNVFMISKDYSGIPSQRVVYFIRDFKKILENVRDKKLQ